MSTYFTRIVSTLVTFFVLTTSGTAQILTFDFAGLSGSESTAASNFNHANLSASTISRGSGLTALNNADRFNATNWALNSIANAVSGDKYMEFTITPNPTYQFNISSIQINLQRSGTGPSAVSLRSSLDGYTSDLGGVKTIVDNTSTQSFTFTFSQANSSAAVTYRFYMYAEATGGSGGIGDGSGNDIIVNGSVSAVGGLSITATADANGNISPSGTVSVTSGADQTFTITPNSCYHISNVLVDGVSVGNPTSYSFTNITANHTINASFAADGPYAISATAGANGSISPAGTTSVSCGNDQPYNITADPGYVVQDVLVDGVSVGAVTTYNFANVTANHTISATFVVYIAPKLVISQVYGGGGNSGAPYDHDFVELFNAGTTAVNLNGWSVQYASSSGSSWQVALLPNYSLPSGKYFLLEMGGGGSGVALPTPDLSVSINMAGSSGKVALVNSITALTSSCPTVIDFVGYGSANCYEGTGAAPTLSNSTWATRADDGCTDTDDNSADFSSTSSVTPRNTSTPANTCTPKYNISTSIGAGGGSIAPSGTVQVPMGTDQTFTISPDGCHTLTDVLVDGISQGAITSYTFANVTSAHTLSASFTSKGPYSITATAGANGSISPSGTTPVNCGSNQSYAITANSGYAVSDVVVDGVSQGAITTYTFNNVTGTHTISVSFVAVVYSITTATSIPSFLCPGSTVDVPFTINYPANAGNVFTAQLSNSSGSFASPTTIGTWNATGSGTITATLPAGVASGYGYRIRVVSSTPAVTGSTNGSDITIQFSTATPIFTESMGIVSSTTTIGSLESSDGFDNDVFTMSGTGDVRSNSYNSAGYQDASGNAHIFLPSGSSTFFQMDGISTIGLFPLSLNFAVAKSTTTDDGSALAVEYSTNGGSTWTAVPWGILPTGSGTSDGNWTLLKVAGVIPQSGNLSLRFTNNSTTVYYRIDDIGLYSGTATTASVSPASPPAQCGGTVLLTALPNNAAYSWTGGTANQTLALTSSGSYFVTVTDRFGCSASAGPVNVTINAPVTPAVSITPLKACAGISTTFTAAPVNGGSSPSFTWKVNGTPQGTGSSFTATLNTGDQVTCDMQSSLTCVTSAMASSNLVAAQSLSYAPTTVWTETFGNSGSTNLASYGGYSNGQGLSFSGTPSGYPEIRTSQASPAGGSNMFFASNGTAGGNVVLTVSGINTTMAYPNRLSFYLWNDAFPISDASFPLAYSTDGTTYHPLSYGPTPSAQGWYLITINDALPYGNNIRLRFTNGGGLQPRIDALKLEKYTNGSATISPSGPTTFCNGSNVTLNALPTDTGLSYLWSNNSTASSITVTSAGNQTVTVSDVFGCQSTALQSIIVNNCGPNTWLGYTVDWTTNSNWSLGVAPASCSDDVLIPSHPTGGNFPIISLASPSVGNLEIQNGARLTINDIVKVCGNLTGGNDPLNVPAITGSSYVELDGSNQQTINGRLQLQTLRLNNASGAVVQNNSNTLVDLFVALELENGLLEAGTNRLRFRSTSATDGAIIDNYSTGFTGSLTGSIEVQRYYNQPVSASYRQHFMSAPVNQPALSQFGASGTPGFVMNSACDETHSNSNSPYGTVFSYDETHGTVCDLESWEALTNGNAENAKGYSVVRNGAGVLSLKGTANLDATYTITGLTNSGWSNTSLQGRLMESGWYLAGNPYLSTLNLQTLLGADIDAQVQVWNTATGQYDEYVIGSDPVIPIAPFQAFMIHKSTVGGTATATLHADNRSRTVPSTFFQQQHPEELTIWAQNTQTGLTDKTKVAFNSNATAQFDPAFDANKFYGLLTNHTLYTLNNGHHLARNTLKSIEATETVPLSMYAGTGSTYVLSFDGIQSFDPTTYIYLEDKEPNTYTDIRQSPTYSFTMNAGDDPDRFALHFTPAVRIAATAATCENYGHLTVEQSGNVFWNYTIHDAANALISSGNLNASNSVSMQATAGVYFLTLTDTTGYQVVKQVTVNGANPISASYTADRLTAMAGEALTFSNTTANSATSSWEFSDGSVIQNSDVISYTFTEPGIYTLTLTVTNESGCQSAITKTITITGAPTATGIAQVSDAPFRIFNDHNKVVVDFGATVEVDATVSIYNLLGQQLSKERTFDKVYSKPISEVQRAYVIVSVREKTGVTTKRLLLAKE